MVSVVCGGVGVTDAVQPTTDGDVTTFVAVGIGGVLGLLAIAAGAVALALWIVKRNQSNGMNTSIVSVVVAVFEKQQGI